MDNRESTIYFGRSGVVAEGELLPSENVNCPLCGVPPHIFATDYQGFNLCRCELCNLEFVSPRLTFEDLSEKVYSADYYDALEGPEEQSPETIRYLSRPLTKIEGLLGRKGSILDIGCGSGAFLGFAQKAGWDITGADIKCSPEVRRLNCQILEGRLDDLDFGDLRFDAIRLNHVLEHTQNPLDVLSRCRELLIPGGMLYVSVPNIAGLSSRLKSLQSRLYLKAHRWRHYAAMHHIFFFSPVTLAKLIDRAGLQVVKCETPFFTSSAKNSLYHTLYKSITERTLTGSILDFYCTGD